MFVQPAGLCRELLQGAQHGIDRPGHPPEDRLHAGGRQAQLAQHRDGLAGHAQQAAQGAAGTAEPTGTTSGAGRLARTTELLLQRLERFPVALGGAAHPLQGLEQPLVAALGLRRWRRDVRSRDVRPPPLHVGDHLPHPRQVPLERLHVAAQGQRGCPQAVLAAAAALGQDLRIPAWGQSESVTIRTRCAPARPGPAPAPAGASARC